MDWNPSGVLSGVPVSPTAPQSDWEGTCKFDEPGTYRFESSTLFNDGVENFTKYEVVVGESVQAQPPEFGRCRAVTGEMVGGKTVDDGAYSNSGCSKASPGAKGKFEWYPGVVKTHFTTATKSGAKVLFETVKGMKVTCTGETSSGEYASPKLEDEVVFRFTGCDFSERHGGTKDVAYPASSAGAAEGEIVTNPTECELGVVKKGAMPSKDKIALSCAEENEFMWIKWKVPSYLGNLEAELCLKGWWFFTSRPIRCRCRQHSDPSSQRAAGVGRVRRRPSGTVGIHARRWRVRTRRSDGYHCTDERRTGGGERGRLTGLSLRSRGASGAYHSARALSVSEVTEFPWGSFVLFEDPDGSRWAIQQLPMRG